jgi:hypothetical protein
VKSVFNWNSFGSHPGTVLSTFTSVFEIGQISGIVSNVYGYSSEVDGIANGNVSSVRHFAVLSPSNDNAAISSGYGLYVDDMGQQTWTAYGVYIASQSGVVSTYGVYQAGSGDQNVFAGDVAIGTTSMSGTEKLRVFATTASAGIIGTLLQAETTAGTPGTVSALDVQYLVNGGTASLGYAQRISVGGGGGAITTMYGIEIADLSSSGSTTTAYPVYISDQTATTLLRHLPGWKRRPQRIRR